MIIVLIGFVGLLSLWIIRLLADIHYHLIQIQDMIEHGVSITNDLRGSEDDREG